MVIDVKSSDFEKLIIKESFEKPVLVDFWASWCAPCKSLGKILDELQLTYNEKYVFAKVNTEKEQEISRKLNISSIPYVVIIYKGKIRDHFTGALPESEIIKFLDRNLPDKNLQKSFKLFEDNKLDEAVELIINNKLKSIDTDELIWKIIVQYFKKEPELEKIQKLIEQFTEYGGSYFDQKDKLKIFFKRLPDSPILEKFKKILKPEKTQTTLDFILDEISNSTGEKKEAFKNLLFLGFLLLENNPLVSEYRKKLSRILF